MRNTDLKDLVEKAERWNTKHPIGTPVFRYRLVNPLREPERTKTRSLAWVIGGHSVVVMVEGVAGGVLLESVIPEAAAAKANEDAYLAGDGLSPRAMMRRKERER